jgi:exopolysaccharide biosynthesis polyprenyl glycosylphosphotransferase
MLKRYSRFFVASLAVVDGLVVWLAWLAARGMWFSVFPGSPAGRPPSFSVHLGSSLVAVAACLGAFHVRGLYRSARMQKLAWEAGRIVQGIVIAVFVIGAVSFFYRGHSLSRGVLAYFAVLALLGLSGFRICLRLFLRYLRRKGLNLRFILIVGAGSSARELARNMEKHAHLGLVVQGFLDDDAGGPGAPPGLPLLGRIDDLPKVLAEKTVDQIYIALPRRDDRYLERVFELLNDQVVDVRIVPDFSQFVALNASAEDFEGMPIIHLTEKPLHGWRRLSKRAFDVVLSLVGIVILSPLMALIAILVKCTSRGPVLYVQERVGYDGRTFCMYKFRSMENDAEKETGAVWARRHDPRCTGVGRFLRRFSLDEIPQLWNVLKGDMSFVGPRPEREVFVDAFRKKIPRYMMRHKIKSGITGWAQVNGLRGESPIERRTQFDLFYIKNWSFWFDLKIILITIAKFLHDDHAY